MLIVIIISISLIFFLRPFSIHLKHPNLELICVNHQQILPVNNKYSNMLDYKVEETPNVDFMQLGFNNNISNLYVKSFIFSLLYSDLFALL